MIIPFSFATIGNPHRALAGTRVAYSLPAGCALRVSTDLQVWSTVVEASPFVVGQDVHLRVDCDSFTSPVAAELSISR